MDNECGSFIFGKWTNPCTCRPGDTSVYQCRGGDLRWVLDDIFCMEHVGLFACARREDGGPLACFDLFLGGKYGWCVVNSAIPLLHGSWNFELSLGNGSWFDSEYSTANGMENIRHA